METVKTADLEGAALDWAVAECEGKQICIQSGVCHDAELLEMKVDGDTRLIYAADWAQGGPIIERERIAVVYRAGGYWIAYTFDGAEFEGAAQPRSSLPCAATSPRSWATPWKYLPN